jgi:hypothetical protein
MPHLPEDYIKQAEKITTAFLGDPSFFAYNGEEPEPEDPEAPPVERFREVHRLAWTVNVSNWRCFIVIFNISDFYSNCRELIMTVLWCHEEPSPWMPQRKSF